MFAMRKNKILLVNYRSTWGFPKMGIPPDHPFIDGFSISETIHFWGSTILGKRHFPLSEYNNFPIYSHLIMEIVWYVSSHLNSMYHLVWYVSLEKVCIYHSMVCIGNSMYHPIRWPGLERGAGGNRTNCWTPGVVRSTASGGAPNPARWNGESIGIPEAMEAAGKIWAI